MVDSWPGNLKIQNLWPNLIQSFSGIYTSCDRKKVLWRNTLLSLSISSNQDLYLSELKMSKTSVEKVLALTLESKSIDFTPLNNKSDFSKQLSECHFETFWPHSFWTLYLPKVGEISIDDHILQIALEKLGQDL